jgi:predicted nucleic acid-binding protein
MRLLVDTNLIIDHAYQCSAAKRHGLKIVSFDADFDRTTEGRLLPTDVL